MKNEIKNLDLRQWPNFFIVGAPRCGTTSLYEYLKAIPGIFMSPVKEPGYFIPNDPRGYTEEKYLKLFENVKNEKLIGEASAGYLASKETPSIIKKQIPDAKIIITLRDPCERVFSHYLNRLRTGDETISFDEAIDNFVNGEENPTLSSLIHVGYYYANVERYLEIFGKDKVKILIFEETVKDTRKAIEDLLTFLGHDSKVPDEVSKQHNAYAEPLGDIGKFLTKNRIIGKIGKKVIPKEKREAVLRTLTSKNTEKPRLTKKSRQELIKIFHNDVRNLEGLLERELPWLKEK